MYTREGEKLCVHVCGLYSSRYEIIYGFHSRMVLSGAGYRRYPGSRVCVSLSLRRLQINYIRADVGVFFSPDVVTRHVLQSSYYLCMQFPPRLLCNRIHWISWLGRCVCMCLCVECNFVSARGANKFPRGML